MVVIDNEVHLLDLNGDDPFLKSEQELLAQVQRHSVASLPFLYSRAMGICKYSKNEKSVLEAMKFIKSLADGKHTEKHVDSIAKKMTNDELEKELANGFEDQED